MIDQTTLNFLAKLSVACLVVSITLMKSVDCRALEGQPRQYSNSEISAAAPSTNQVFQYQQQVQSPFVQHQSSSSSNYQYYDQQPQQNAHYQSFNNEVEFNTNNKPNRRSILSSIMAPFYAMRDQGMSMLQASLQGCNPNTFSMWCRFWSMFIRRR